MEQGSRAVPIIFGLILWGIAGIIFWFFSNFLATIVGGMLLLAGWKAAKLGIWGSQQLLDEMCLEENEPGLDTKEEWENLTLGQSSKSKKKSPKKGKRSKKR